MQGLNRLASVLAVTLAMVATFATFATSACDKDGGAAPPAPAGADKPAASEPTPPPVAGDAPPVVGDAPPVAGDAPPVVGDAPPVVGGAPPVVGGAPPVVGDAPKEGIGANVTCTPDTRKGGMCTREYSPVCGSLADNTSKTFSNKCVACSDEKVVRYVAGPCPGDPPR